MAAHELNSVSLCWERRMDKRTREALIKRHAGLVRLIVSRIAGHLPEHVDREDLTSAGILGLIKAIDRYDPSRGVKFETYATPSDPRRNNGGPASKGLGSAGCAKACAGGCRSGCAA
ncbi:MAG: hypothetical protein H5T86_10180 [Armatimonadetes bacterium]|nr:hypothetical protein [Armatimonadota bacterium]